VLGQGKIEFMAENLQKPKEKSEKEKDDLSSALRKNLLRRKTAKKNKTSKATDE